ncbi:MAG: Flp pilus assembly protein CpaB [Candidatus Sericytochromatia bacterium]
MGKVNLRNKLRGNNEDNFENYSTQNNFQSYSNNDSFENQTYTQTYNQNIDNSSFINNQTELQNNLYNQNQNYNNDINSFDSRKYNYENEGENKFNGIKKRNSGLFKENDDEKGITGILSGTKKLFTKKLDSFSNPRKGILNNLNKRMLFLSIALSSVATLLAMGYLNKLSANITKGTTPYNVLVSKRNIKEKAVITEQDIEIQSVPQLYLSENAIFIKSNDDIKKYLGRIAILDISKNEQLSDKKIVTTDKSPWTSPVIPENHRSFNIPVKDINYVKPGDAIDILVSVPDPLNNSKNINTPVLQNTRVFSVNGKVKMSANDNDKAETIMVAVPNNLVNLFSLLQEKKASFKIVVRNEYDNQDLEEKVSIERLESLFSYTPQKEVIRATPRPINFIPKPSATPFRPIIIYKTPDPIKPRVVFTPLKPIIKETPKPKVSEKPKMKITIISGSKIRTTEFEKKEENH